MTRFEERWVKTFDEDYKLSYVEKHLRRCCEGSCALHGRRANCDSCPIAEAAKRAIKEIESGDRSVSYAAGEARVYYSKKGVKTLTLF